MAADAFKNSYKVEEKEMVSLIVSNVGYQKCEPGYQWGPGIRDHYILHHIVSGKGTFTANGETCCLSGGDTFLVHPFTKITYCADLQEPWEYYWVGFSGSDASLLLRSTDFTLKNPFIKNNSYTENIKEHILAIYHARGNNFVHAVEMTGKLYLLLSFFVRETAVPKNKKDTYLNYAQKGVEYISRRYSYPITVDSIAKYVGISRSHLYRAFQLYTGISPKEYLSDFRIKQACSLLKHSDLSITAISTSVGFENSLYFSKAFRKIKGIPPSDYAKRYKS